MKKYLILSILLLGSFSAKASTDLETLSADILKTIQEYYPVNSTMMGIHTYDDKLTDYSDNAVKKMIDKMNNFEKKLYRYKGADLNLHDDIDYKLIKSNVDMEIYKLKLTQGGQLLLMR